MKRNPKADPPTEVGVVSVVVGGLFASTAQTITNTVNCRGVEESERRLGLRRPKYDAVCALHATGATIMDIAARDLRDDYEEGLMLVHNNGQTEGFINELKLTKRSMYGRGRFDLLRQRVLHAAPANGERRGRQASKKSARLEEQDYHAPNTRCRCRCRLYLLA